MCCKLIFRFAAHLFCAFHPIPAIHLLRLSPFLVKVDKVHTITIIPHTQYTLICLKRHFFSFQAENNLIIFAPDFT